MHPKAIEAMIIATLIWVAVVLFLEIFRAGYNALKHGPPRDFDDDWEEIYEEDRSIDDDK